MRPDLHGVRMGPTMQWAKLQREIQRGPRFTVRKQQ